jgi:hypothetical protein
MVMSWVIKHTYDRQWFVSQPGASTSCIARLRSPLRFQHILQIGEVGLPLTL